jgi:phosphatidylinositol dimannoside acyltransferase
MGRAMDRLRNESRDLVELVLVPGLAAVLPWSICFRLFRWICFHTSFLYRDQCERALAQANARGWVGAGAGDGARWLATRRLVTLIDHADFWLERSRSDAWMREHLRVDGAWPATNHAAVLCTFHWGAGMWALRHAGAAGLRAHMMVAPARGAHFGEHAVARWCAKHRIGSIERALRSATLDVSAPLRPTLRALQKNEPVIAVVDVPADQVVASQPVQLLGMTAQVPRALLRLAVEHAIPLRVFWTGIDFATGERFLVIKDFGVRTEVDALVNAVFAELESVIVASPPSWHFWGEAERFFRR